MDYHINTGLILQEFAKNSECPVCEIKKIVESQLVDQFLNEAVMVDSYRKNVNEKGFCKAHTKMLFSRSNKLGLALQHSTRIKTLLGKITVTKNLKQAKKQAEYFRHSTTTCIICHISKMNMDRYYKTIAKMYNTEKKFAELLNATNGFCSAHYADLLDNSAAAGGKTADYLNDLTALQKKHLERIVDELVWFCDKHDYRNQDLPWKNSKDSLQRSITKLHGSDD